MKRRGRWSGPLCITSATSRRRPQAITTVSGKRSPSSGARPFSTASKAGRRKTAGRFCIWSGSGGRSKTTFAFRRRLKPMRARPLRKTRRCRCLRGRRPTSGCGRCARPRPTWSKPCGRWARGSPWDAGVKVSDEFLTPLFEAYFQKLGLPNLMRKKNFHQLAEYIPIDEIDPEVGEKLDAIASVAQSASARPAPQ